MVEITAISFILPAVTSKKRVSGTNQRIIYAEAVHSLHPVCCHIVEDPAPGARSAISEALHCTARHATCVLQHPSHAEWLYLSI